MRAAYSGRAALEIGADFAPQIVLLDIVMPDLTGHEVARRIREQLGRDVQIVAISGFGADEDRQRALEAGFDQHVVKPVDPAFLKSLLG